MISVTSHWNRKFDHINGRTGLCHVWHFADCHWIYFDISVAGNGLQQKQRNEELCPDCSGNIWILGIV